MKKIALLQILGYLIDVRACFSMYKNQVSETVNNIEFSSYDIITTY